MTLLTKQTDEDGEGEHLSYYYEYHMLHYITVSCTLSKNCTCLLNSYQKALIPIIWAINDFEPVYVNLEPFFVEHK
jgi:hypothetical protein